LGSTWYKFELICIFYIIYFLGLILPNGSINWDCPCLGGMASGPCGIYFRRAFTCFHNSDSKAKGSECFSEFSALTECFAKYPKLYGNKDKSSSSSSTDTQQTTSATTAIANAFNSQT
jgi:intermembrane space import and assembly protein 40